MQAVIAGRERSLVVGGLLVLTALAWLYLLDQASDMGGMTGGAASGEMAAEMAGAGGAEVAWTLRDLGYLFVMWSVMMVAMMLPSATPTILLFATLQRTRRERADAHVAGVSAASGRVHSGGGRSESVPSGSGPVAGISSWRVTVAAFVVGYLLVWTAFSLGAAWAQWLLHQGLLVSTAMVSASPWLSGGLLLLAGAFQFTRLKEACVGHCRSPLSFLTSHWCEGTGGAVRMGLRHGAFCVGCCWALMALLFVLGVMNLLWVLALSIFVLAEKTFPGQVWITRGAGAVFIGWAAWVVLSAVAPG